MEDAAGMVTEVNQHYILKGCSRNIKEEVAKSRSPEYGARPSLHTEYIFYLRHCARSAEYISDTLLLLVYRLKTNRSKENGNATAPFKVRGKQKEIDNGLDLLCVYENRFDELMLPD